MINDFNFRYMRNNPKISMLYEKLLLPKTVQLVTFIVKDYVTCETTFEHQYNACPLPDLTTFS